MFPFLFLIYVKSEHIVKNIIKEVNTSLGVYKKGGWIDCRRTPSDEIPNLVEDLTNFVEARFNRECWNVPELLGLCEAFDGKAFKCTLIGANEEKKKFEQAIITLPRPENVEIESEDPDKSKEELLEMLKSAESFFGGNKITFYSYKAKIKYFTEYE